MTHYYYTVASKEYTYKVMLLHDSMMKYDYASMLFIICLSNEGREVLEKLRLPNAVLIDIEVLEAFDEELKKVKETRSIKQYAWVAKPVAALYILDRYREVDQLVWLDGDTLFMSDPAPLYREWGDYPVALTEEKFTGKYSATADIYGYYNTGFMGYRRSEAAITCLQYFREKLLQWNNDEKEQYRWNDQLYVSDWPLRFGNIGVIKNPGVNMTPFIYNRLFDEMDYKLYKADGCLNMGEVKIILFHFYGLNYFNRYEFELCCYTDIYDKAEVEYIYIPYLKECIKAIACINEIAPEFYSEKPADWNNVRNYLYLGRKSHGKVLRGRSIKGKMLLRKKNADGRG